MTFDRTCPHCSRPARSIWSKLNDSGLRATVCCACGKSIQLDVRPTSFLIYMFGILPVLWLPRFWLRVAAMVLLSSAMVLLRMWRCRYVPHHEPITYGS